MTLPRFAQHAMLMTTLALSACATTRTETSTTVRIGADGLSAVSIPVEWGYPVRFVNADTRPHELYSNDCAELSSTVLQPGDSFDAVLDPGPKSCHFQDLLAPDAFAYIGTVEVTGSRNGVFGSP